MLNKNEVEKFKKLAFEVYGLRLTDKEALEQGSRLIKLFELFKNTRLNIASSATISQKKMRK